MNNSAISERRRYCLEGIPDQVSAQVFLLICALVVADAIFNAISRRLDSYSSNDRPTC